MIHDYGSEVATFTVLEFCVEDNHHICVDCDGDKHRIDLMADGSFENLEPEELVGKRIQVEYLFAYVEIAMYPRIVESTT